MKITLTERAGAWSRYWSSGAQHSCAGSYNEALHGAVGSFWRRGMTDLRIGARILDLATGNGPLPRLMLSLTEREDLSCDAVDMATPAPAWTQALASPIQQRLRFHPACSMEALPFAEASFDAVISQWGFEYSELAQSCPELLRVLKPDGEILMVLHHHQALPVVLAEDELAHLDWLTQPEGFWTTALQLLGPMELAATAEGRQQLKEDPQANQLRERFNSLQDQLKARADTGRCTDILDQVAGWIGPLFSTATQNGIGQAISSWNNLQLVLEDAQLRLRELRAHALDEQAARSLARQLAGDSDYVLQPLMEQDTIMGWSLRITRRP